MKNLFLSFFILATFHQVHAHDYYFAFAEVEYNEEHHRFEGTIIVTTHDFETAITNDGHELPALETIQAGDSSFAVLSSYLFDHFNINVSNSELKLDLIGIEVFMVGTSNFYFESEQVEMTSDCEFTFDLLMDTFREQQNKMTFIYKESNYTLHFLQQQRKKSFKPENENND